MENRIFNDYANWLIEYDDLLSNLETEVAFLYERYAHIYRVINYIYNLKVESNEISEDELDIFIAGFTFLFEVTESVNSLVKFFYNGDIKMLQKHEEAISLFLDLQEFIVDLESILEDTDKLKPLIEIEDEVYSCLKENKPIRDDLYEEFNVESIKIYHENEIKFYPLKEIFYDIALIYDLN